MPWSDRRLTVRRMNRAAKWRRMRGYSSMRRAALARALTEFDAATRLQRAFRRRGPAVCNDTDPLTLDPIGDVGRCFCYTTANGERIAYNAARLADYIASTGASVDPVTREAYSAADLGRLQAQAPACRDNLAASVERAARAAAAPPPPVGPEAIVQIIIDDLVAHAEGVVADPAAREGSGVQFSLFVIASWASAYHIVTALLADTDVERAMELNESVPGRVTDALEGCPWAPAALALVGTVCDAVAYGLIEGTEELDGSG